MNNLREQNLTNLDRDLFNSKVTNAIITDLTRIGEPGFILAVEEYLNENNTSIYKVAEEPEKVSQALYDLFGEAIILLINKMVDAAFRSFGIPPSQSYSSSNALKCALKQLESITMQRYGN